MSIASRQALWESGFNPLDYCFVANSNAKIVTDINIQHTSAIGMEVVALMKNGVVPTGSVIFGHTGSSTGTHYDNYDFRFFIAGSGSAPDVYVDRANGRSNRGSYNVFNKWLQVRYEGNGAVYLNNTAMSTSSTPTYSSYSSYACFFGAYVDSVSSQNNVAVRYARIYDISTGQDIVFFVPDPAGMRDLVTGNVYASQSSSAQFEVVKWKDVSTQEAWQ